MFTSILAMTFTRMKVIIIFSAMLKILFLSGSFAEDTFDVLIISNVPFPHSPNMAAVIRSPLHHKEIPELKFDKDIHSVIGADFNQYSIWNVKTN